MIEYNAEIDIYFCLFLLLGKKRQAVVKRKINFRRQI